MKILLVRPPATFWAMSQVPSAGLPLGMLYVAAVLEREGFPPRVLDAQLGGVSGGPGERLLGMPWDEVRRFVDRERPDVVGISNQYSAQFHNALAVARIAKEIDPAVFVVVGGPHATVSPGSFLDGRGFVDAVVRGEGEYAMLEIVRRLRDGKGIEPVPGVVTGDTLGRNPAIAYIDPLDDLPLPAYHLVDMERYFESIASGSDGRPRFWYPGAERSVSMVTSRGCPYTCTFCSIGLHMGRKLRKHSAARAVAHLRHLQERYAVNHVHFEDDNLMLDRGRFADILRGVKGLERRLTWDTPNGVRAENLTDGDLVQSCAESGCTYLIMGVESGDQDVIDRIVKKKLRLENVRLAAETCRDRGVDLEAFYVIGFPGETRRNIDRTVEFGLDLYSRLGVYPYFFIATPLLGTELHRLSVEGGWLRKEVSPHNLSVSTQGAGMIETDQFDAPWLRSRLVEAKRRLRLLQVRRAVVETAGGGRNLPAVARYLAGPGAGMRFRNLIRYPRCVMRAMR